ncbi:unnamed protein product [Durusdinium trenchii]|uniref:C3H1-type domain-containing protein n=1 Tax=Durusdinium trenchii TaxID=1381693 RepID=A0ABP0R1Z2_9DINO
MPILKYSGTFICVEEKRIEKRTKSLPPVLARPSLSRTEMYVSSLESHADALSFLPEKPPPTPNSTEGTAMETGATQNEMPHSAFPSAGSVGHPELCRRPCILFKHGACHKGANCEYCHCNHTEYVKLDKYQRETLHALSPANVLGLVLPHLRKRATKMDDPNAPEEVLGLMEQYLASMPSETNKWIPVWKLAKLNHTLSQMCFLRLVNLCPCRTLPHIQYAIEMLQQQYSGSE